MQREEHKAKKMRRDKRVLSDAGPRDNAKSSYSTPYYVETTLEIIFHTLYYFQ